MDTVCTDYLAEKKFPCDRQIIDHISFICNVPRRLGCDTEWFPKVCRNGVSSSSDVKQSKTNWPLKMQAVCSQKRWEPLTQQHSVTSQ